MARTVWKQPVPRTALLRSSRLIKESTYILAADTVLRFRTSTTYTFWETPTLVNITNQPLNFGTGISTIKMAAKFEIISLYSSRNLSKSNRDAAPQRRNLKKIEEKFWWRKQAPQIITDIVWPTHQACQVLLLSDWNWTQCAQSLFQTIADF